MAHSHSPSQNRGKNLTLTSTEDGNVVTLHPHYAKPILCKSNGIFSPEFFYISITRLIAVIKTPNKKQLKEGELFLAYI